MNADLSLLFRNCLDILRTDEASTGRTALNILGFLMNLKLLERRIGDGLEIDLNELDLSEYSDEDIRKFKKICVFSNLSQEKENTLKGNMDRIWNDFLSVHSKTKSFFPKEKSFGIKRDRTFKKMIEAIQAFDDEYHISDLDHDILGSIYEEVIQHQMTGRDLGQHFTPTKVKNMIIRLIQPQLFEDGTCETIYDPAMGTGGFLISSIRHYMTQSNERNIDIDWEFMRSGALSGRDPETDTFTLAMSNMLISTGHIFELEHDDSIRSQINREYDIILTNPPFGLKGINYDDVFDKKCIPIVSTNGIVLFLQIIIHCMKINGRCAVVLPAGKELGNKDQVLVMVRKFLMKTCDLKKVIHLPSGVFEHTSISTCVFYFEKKKTRNEVLKLKDTESKKTLDLFLDEDHSTTEVIFSNFDVDTEEIHEIQRVPIQIISKNQYSLNYKEYIKNDKLENTNDEIPFMVLENICKINYGTRIVKSKSERGEYPVYGGGDETFSTNKFNREGYQILIGRFGISEECVRLLNKRFYLNDSGLTLDSKDPSVLIKYIGYYLSSNQNRIFDLGRGPGQKNLDMDAFKKLKIPIPSIQKQMEIIEYLDQNELMIKALEDKIKDSKRIAKEYLSSQINKSNPEQKEDSCFVSNPPLISSIQFIEEAREEAQVRPKGRKKPMVSAPVEPPPPPPSESIIDEFLQETIEESNIVVPKKKKKTKKILPKSSEE